MSLSSSTCPTGPREILIIGKGGSLFNPGDYKELAKLIIVILRQINKKKGLKLIMHINISL